MEADHFHGSLDNFKIQRTMILRRKNKKRKDLWMETPDGQKLRYVGRNENNTTPEWIEKEKKTRAEVLKRNGSKYTIDQYKFYFE